MIFMHLHHITRFALPSAGAAEQWVQAVRCTNGVSGEGSVSRLLPAVLPGCTRCDIFRIYAFLWAALITAACECQFLCMISSPCECYDVCALPGGQKHSLKVTLGSCSREILNHRAVTQAWEQLIRVVCNIIPAHCAHYAHTVMLFLVLKPVLWFPNSKCPAAEKQESLIRQ